MSCASSMPGCPWAGVPDVRYWKWSRQMSSVQIEQKSYEMPPREGISIAHFLTVADIKRSARYYEQVFSARILSLGDGNAPGYLQLANIWMILNVGGGPNSVMSAVARTCQRVRFSSNAFAPSCPPNGFDFASLSGAWKSRRGAMGLPEGGISL